jgi:hypothetical protein
VQGDKKLKSWAAFYPFATDSGHQRRILDTY